MKKLVVILVILSLLLVACGSKDAPAKEEEKKGSEEPKETPVEETPKEGKKEWIVGFDNTFAPMGFQNEKGEDVGFDLDLAALMEEKLDVKFVFQPIDWSIKETELNNGNIDMIWNGYTVTEKRKEVVLFSEPYMKNRQIVLVNKDAGIGSIDELEGKNVSTQAQSSALEAIEKSPIASKLNELITYASYNEVFNDLKNKRADAIVVDETMGLYYLSTSGETDDYNLLKEDFGEEDYAVGFRKEDEAFVKEFNVALKELIDEGEVQKIYEKWFQ